MNVFRFVRPGAAVLALLLGALCPAHGSDSRRNYLTSKLEEVLTACAYQIKATAKDPDSVSLAKGSEPTYSFGNGFTRNWIFVTVPIMSRNSYGAVLRHDMVCTYSCTEKKGCSLVGLEDHN